MPGDPTPRHSFSGNVVLLALLATLALSASPAAASGPPLLGAVWSASVSSSTARLQAEVNPNGLATTYRFDYITTTAYEANLSAGKDGFTGAKRAPPLSDAAIGSGSATLTVLQLLSGLSPDTAYRYRVVAKNPTEATSPTFSFTTEAPGGALLPDTRGWELVSPVEKNDGQADPPGAIAGGGVLQAAAGGGAVTYGSTASFGAGAQGAPPASQYLATRATGGWSTENITAPLLSGSYPTEEEGVPYRLFSADLARGLLLNGRRCRGEGEGCAVPNPPLPGTDAPEGYQNYYLRESATGAFEALLTTSALPELNLDPAEFELSLAGAAPDLRHVVLSTCAALTPDATEVPLGEGCDPNRPNLYEYSPGAGLSLVNVLPGQSEGSPGAALAAQSGAVSTDGSRVYWRALASGDLYLREGAQTKLVQGGGGSFQSASTNGSIAYYTKAEHLYRYEAAADSTTDLAPSGGVVGVLGVSEDGQYLYYATGGGLFLRHGATSTEVAPAADPDNYPPTTGTARVSADGTHLLLSSTARLTGYDNTDLATGEPDPQLYLYDDTAPSLTCVSCNPTNQRPLGPASVPGAIANGSAPGSPSSYKPRALSADGRRVFFNSKDALALADTNNAPDVYQWEAQGEGSCTRSGGCISLISSGKAPGGASFVDASADGSDAFFLTEASLVGGDPGSLDLYDARSGGGFPELPAPIPCKGDACQVLPSEPVDPTLTTLLEGPGNPAVRYHRLGHHKKSHKARHHHKKSHRHFVYRGGRR